MNTHFMRAAGVKIEQLKEHRAEALESRFAIAEECPVEWPAGTGTPAAVPMGPHRRPVRTGLRRPRIPRDAGGRG